MPIALSTAQRVNVEVASSPVFGVIHSPFYPVRVEGYGIHPALPLVKRSGRLVRGLSVIEVASRGAHTNGTCNP
jgi:hypothetical protein